MKTARENLTVHQLEKSQAANGSTQTTKQILEGIEARNEKAMTQREELYTLKVQKILHHNTTRLNKFKNKNKKASEEDEAKRQRQAEERQRSLEEEKEKQLRLEEELTFKAKKTAPVLLNFN